MLVLSRRTDDTIVVGSEIVIRVVAVQGNRVKIGIDAPDEVRVLRGELTTHPPEPMTCARLPLGTTGDMAQSPPTIAVPQ